MFDVGFSELLLVGLIALLVFGPERLPRVAREAGLWIKKARNMASSVKQEIDHELQMQELKETMDKQKREMERMLLMDKTTDNPTQAMDTKPADKSEEGRHE